MTRVSVAVSTNFMHADPNRAFFRHKTLQYFEERMLRAVWTGGAMPVPIVSLDAPDVLDFASASCDGLVLTGGADLAPESYGEAPIRPEWTGDPVRDAYEIALVQRFLTAGKPVLAICRGIQLLNVALGGTLHQDIELQVDDALVHRDWHRYDELGHDLRLEAGSRVAAIVGTRQTAVNSVHHQAIKKLAPDLRATAWAPDGIIEAVEWRSEKSSWLLGVQWHPEWLEPERIATDLPARDWSDGSMIFSAFVDACRR